MEDIKIIKGTMESQKISDEEFSYTWICSLHNIRYHASYRSPGFGSICKELSECYLESIYDNSGCSSVYVIRLVLQVFEKQNGSIIIFSATAEYGDGLSPFSTRPSSHSLSKSGELLNLDSPIEIFALPSSIVFAPSVLIRITFCKYFSGRTPSFLKDSVKTEYIKLENIKKTDTSFKSFPKSLQNSSKENLKPISYVDDPKELIQNLESLFTSGDMSDLKINIDKEVLRAHRLILCSRSPVFRKMMEHDCLESTSNSITITDCSIHLFKKFLKYLYTGEIEDTTLDTVMSLYSLGDKYDVSALRKACSKILRNKLSSESVENVADIVSDVLQLADCHNDSELKDLSTSFIVDHFPRVSKKQNWKDMIKSNFELTSEILAVVAAALEKSRA